MNWLVVVSSTVAISNFSFGGPLEIRMGDSVLYRWCSFRTTLEPILRQKSTERFMVFDRSKIHFTGHRSLVLFGKMFVAFLQHICYP